jgi:tetratricopeptide (TPR) repeat protein
MQEGDVVFARKGDQFHILRILKIDLEFDTFHVMMYKPYFELPERGAVQELEVSLWHTLVDGESIERQFTFVDNVAVSQEDLCGYIEYLKRTDFPRYLRETDQDADTVVQEAVRHYNHGCNLSDLRKPREAFEAYSRAIEMFPMYYQAIDNRGLTRMELGDLRGAIDDFWESLRVRPNNPLPVFSVGECYFKLQDYSTALEYFLKAEAIEPANKLIRKWLKKTRAVIRKRRFESGLKCFGSRLVSLRQRWRKEAPSVPDTRS